MTHSQLPPELAYEVQRVQRGLQAIKRSVWDEGIYEAARDGVALVRQPPRWFLVLLASLGIVAVLFFVCSMTGAVASQADFLRSLMP